MLHPINPLLRQMHSPISLERVFASRGPNVISTKFADDEVVVVDQDTGKVLQLTQIGAKMWSLLHEVKALREVIRLLMDEYDAPQEQMTATVADIFCELESKGLLEVAGASRA